MFGNLLRRQCAATTRRDDGRQSAWRTHIRHRPKCISAGRIALRSPWKRRLSSKDGLDETWTVERFSPATGVLHRHDAPQSPTSSNSDVVYQGEVSNDRLIDVTVNGHPVPDVSLAWGFALQSLPGSNAERNRRQAAQVAAQAQAQALAARSESPPADVEPADTLDLAVADAPPSLLNDVQVPSPEEGYLWTPGYCEFMGVHPHAAVERPSVREHPKR